jgi:hypothetical protein
MSQQIFPIDQRFFNDGAWYVLSSTSLGNSGLTPEEMVNILQGGLEGVRQLLVDGICLPLFFPGDCALDQVAIVLGDLTAEQESEWLGRIQSKLHIPCGEFLVLGGGGSEEDWETAIHHPAPSDPNLFCNFQKFKIPPGDYLVEVYAFLGSMNFNFQLDEIGSENWEQWFHLQDVTTPPQWFQSLLKNDYIDSQALDLQEYLIRLSPLQEQPPLPILDEELSWCGHYQFRQPQHCPTGLSRSQLLVQADP